MRDVGGLPGGRVTADDPRSTRQSSVSLSLSAKGSHMKSGTSGVRDRKAKELGPEEQETASLGSRDGDDGASRLGCSAWR